MGIPGESRYNLAERKGSSDSMHADNWTINPSLKYISHHDQAKIRLNLGYGMWVQWKLIGTIVLMLIADDDRLTLFPKYLEAH